MAATCYENTVAYSSSKDTVLDRGITVLDFKKTVPLTQFESLNNGLIDDFGIFVVWIISGKDEFIGEIPDDLGGFNTVIVTPATSAAPNNDDPASYDGAQGG